MPRSRGDRSLTTRPPIAISPSDGINPASARNSEVIHGGMYYPTGSLRAKHCVGGRRMLYEFCTSHGVPHKKVGKLIVATDQKQTAKIEGIAKQGEINGVEGLEFLGGNAARGKRHSATSMPASSAARCSSW